MYMYTYNVFWWCNFSLYFLDFNPLPSASAQDRCRILSPTQERGSSVCSPHPLPGKILQKPPQQHHLWDDGERREEKVGRDEEEREGESVQRWRGRGGGWGWEGVWRCYRREESEQTTESKSSVSVECWQNQSDFSHYSGQNIINFECVVLKF